MNYSEIAARRAEQLRREGGLILAIESSCDETSAAVMDGFAIRGLATHTQIPLHEKFGGVVPEIASRDHVKRLDYVTDMALQQAGVTLADIAAVAVTHGPGLVGALLCGVSYAKALAYALNLPLYGVNHIEGHICANYITHPDLAPPYVCLVVSGGHSHIVRVEENGVYRLLGKTRDDAVGEAFDKAARILGLGYPGGPKVDKLAKEGSAANFELPMPRVEGYDYSFSGLKTAMLQRCAKLDAQGSWNKADAAAAFQTTVCTQLTKKAVQAVRDQNMHTLAIAGGVAANSQLRDMLTNECKKFGIRFCAPRLDLCTDNAAMIGAAAHVAVQNAAPSPLDLNAQPALRLPMVP